MKKNNIGKICILKSLENILRTWHGGQPIIKDFMIFVIIGLYHGGYIIRYDQYEGNSFKVQSQDIIIINKQI